MEGQKGMEGQEELEGYEGMDGQEGMEAGEVGWKDGVEDRGRGKERTWRD